MDSESSEDSQEEIDVAGDVEQDAEEDNIEEDAEEDQFKSESLDGYDDQDKPTKSAVTSHPTNARIQPTVRPEALKAAVYDIVPTMYGSCYSIWCGICVLGLCKCVFYLSLRC